MLTRNRHARGTLRALMITTAERMAGLPAVPTARERGYAEMERIVGWSAVLGPAKLPAEGREKLAALLKTSAANPAWLAGWLAGTAQAGSLHYVKSAAETRDFLQSRFQFHRTLGEQLNLIDGKMQ